MVSLIALGVAGTTLAGTPALVREKAQLSIGLVALKTPLAEAKAKKALEAFSRQPGCSSAVSSAKRTDDIDDKALDQPTRASLKKTDTIVTIDLTWPIKDSRRLREAYRAVLTLASEHGAVIVDRDAAYPADKFRTLRIEQGWFRDLPVGPNHFLFRAEPRDGLLTLHTSGLSRFGLSDLTLVEVDRYNAESATHIVNAIVQRLLEGARPDASGRLLVKVAEIQEPGLRESLSDTPYKNATGAITVAFTPLSDTMELSFPELACASRGECLGAAIAQVLGTKDRVTDVKHDAKLLAARARALRDLATYEERFRKGLPPDEVLLVKARFPYPQGNEWMWVEVTRWTDAGFRGRLQNEPEHVKLKSGATVNVKHEDVMDYEYLFQDGSFLGNETGRALFPDDFEPADGGLWRVRHTE